MPILQRGALKRVVVSGSTGFVGRQIISHLTQERVEIRALCRRRNTDVTTQARSRIEWIETPDLFSASQESLIALLKDAHTFIHCAWYTNPTDYLESTENLHCLAGTIKLGQAFARAGGARFVGLGTCFEYCDQSRPLKADSPLGPRTLYAASKAATFLVLSSLFHSTSCQFAWCRIFYLFGDGEDPRRLVPYLHSRISAGLPAEITTGNQIRDYLDVTTAARRIVDVAFDHCVGPVNVCSGVPLSIRELAERIAREYARPDLLRFGARPHKAAEPKYIVGVPGPA